MTKFSQVQVTATERIPRFTIPDLSRPFVGRAILTAAQVRKIVVFRRTHILSRTLQVAVRG